MRILIDAFNAGHVERVIAGVANDVEIVIPIYRLGEMAGPPALRGREILRQRLLNRHKAGSRIELMSITDDETGAIATLKSTMQGQLAVSFKFDDQGLAKRLVVFKQ